jgi:hypothetical protein
VLSWEIVSVQLCVVSEFRNSFTSTSEKPGMNLRSSCNAANSDYARLSTSLDRSIEGILHSARVYVDE